MKAKKTRSFGIRHLSFQRKLMLYSFLLSSVPVFIIGMIASIMSADSVQSEVNKHHRTILQQIQTQTDLYLRTIDYYSIQLATSYAVEKSMSVGPNMEYLDETLDVIKSIQHVRTSSEIRYDVSLVYNRFHSVYSNKFGLIPESEFTYKELLEQVKPKFNGPVIIPGNLYKSTDELLLIRPVPLLKTPSDGLMILHFSLDKLAEWIRTANPDSNRKVIVVNEEGLIMAGSGSVSNGVKLTSISELYYFWSNPQGVDGSITLGGTEYRLSSLKSSFNNWTYIAMTPAPLLTEQSSRIQRLTWTAVLALIALGIGVAVIGSNRLYVPIQRLSAKFYKPDKSGDYYTDGLEAIDSVLQKLVQSNEDMARKWKDSLPYLRENVLLNLLWGVGKQQDIDPLLETGRMLPEGQSFYVCVLQLDDLSAVLSAFHETDRFLFLYAYRKMIEEITEESIAQAITVSPQPGQVVLVAGGEEGDQSRHTRLMQVADQIRESIKNYLKHTVTVTVSHPRKGPQAVSVCYQEALALQNLRMLLGTDVTISQKQIEPSVRHSDRILFKNLKQIALEAVQGQEEEARKRLSLFVNELPLRVHHPETVKGLFAFFIGELSASLQDVEAEVHDIFEEDLYQHLYALPSLKDVEEWLSGTVLPAIHAHLETAYTPKSKAIVQNILQLIHERYDAELSLQQLSDQFQVSPARLSQMFKEETNTNFADYLIRYRMDKATQWLKHTDLPVKEIAERLQYTNVQNFTRIFKQVVGMPPAQYRSRFRGNAEVGG